MTEELSSRFRLVLAKKSGLLLLPTRFAPFLWPLRSPALRRRAYLRLALIFPIAALSTQAGAQSEEQAFGFCAPPYAPPCVKKATPGQLDDACEQKVQTYIDDVFAYRLCLAKETERAVRQSNEVIDRWRCLQRGRKCRRP